MSFSALPLIFAALLALACFSSAASATYAPATHDFSSDAVSAESAINANDLSGVWSAMGASGASTVKFVQQGNQLLLPLVNRPLPYSINATLYGGYGVGQAALWQVNNPNVFCFYTTVVVDVVDTGFMKITWFPHPASNNCLLFGGSVTKYTRPY